jgi:hypothetical protein
LLWRGIGLSSCRLACEFAGALGLVLGIWRPPLGVAAGIGLVLYFVGAVVSHLRVSDSKDIGPATFMLVVAAGALALRVLTWKQGISCHPKITQRVVIHYPFGE